MTESFYALPLKVVCMLTFYHYPTLVYALFACSIDGTKILILRNALVDIVLTPGTFDLDILCAKRL